MMIGSMNNLMNTISFSNAGSIKIVLSGRALTRPGTLHACMLLLRKSRANDTRSNLVLIMDYPPKP